jgi:hypothetical protein
LSFGRPSEREPAENYLPTLLLYWSCELDNATLDFEAIHDATSDITILIELNGGTGK